MKTREFPYDDKQLLQLLAAGDMDAFRKIYERFFPQLYRAARHYLPDRESALDLVQEIFLKIWERRTGFTGIENLHAYLYNTARNSALNALQKSLQARTRESNYARKNGHAENAAEKHLYKRDLDFHAGRNAGPGARTPKTDCLP